jgi:SNF2 family DNA or RNA helicase
LATAPTAAAKRGALTGGALTDEAMSSSKSVLHAGRGGQRGLQQYFAPPEAAGLIAHVLDFDGELVLDPTAGNGALLAPFDKSQRFGIELDRDQIKDGGYTPIRGDLQQIYPLLRCAGIRFGQIALNPPFGLEWVDPLSGKTVNSTVLAYRYAQGLLAEEGHGALIAGRKRFYDEILSSPEGNGVYAVIETNKLFDGAVLPTVIAFFVAPSNRNPDSEVLQQTVKRSGLHSERLAEEVNSHREATCGPVDGAATPYAPSEMRAAFKAAQKEHARRRKARKNPNDHDLYLRGRGKIGANISPLATIALHELGLLRDVERLNNQASGYFALQLREWRRIKDLAAQGLITIEPALEEHVGGVIAASETLITPLYPVRVQQRLGFLDDQDFIKCLVTDPDKGYLAGERYPISVESQVTVTKSERIIENKECEPELRQFEQERKYLHIEIGDHEFDEDASSIRYLTDHFEMPDPQDIEARAPERVRENRELLHEIAADFGWQEKGLDYKKFQFDNLARMLVKGCGLVAWEMGLGKTMAQLVLAEASVRKGAENKALFIIPQDLLAQTQREAKKWFGRQLEPIRNQADARRVAKHLAAGGTGWYVTWYEALSVVGRKKEPLPTRLLSTPVQRRLHTKRREAEREEQEQTPPRTPEDREAIMERHRENMRARLTTDDACPSCRADTGKSWNGEVCVTRKGGCGYVHRSLRVRSAASYLSTAFRHGVICVDELSLIKGDDSLRSRAVRALQSDHKYGFTGTPISNYVNDAFWGLWFCLSGGAAASLRFPYDHDGGKEKFTEDFCVIEYMMGREEDEEQHLRKRRRVLPEVTNVSVFWRLAACNMIRMRKEDTGEPIVPRRYVPVMVPFGENQRIMHRRWLKLFADFFKHKFPEHDLVKKGLVKKMAAGLGQLWKLEFAATLPQADPDLSWIQHAKHPEPLDDPSNWTPKNLKALQIIIGQVRKGEKVLVGSDLVETGKWLCDRLTEKGVRAVHIVEYNKKTGKYSTKSPKIRSDKVTDFVVGDAQVLCVGVNAMRLGHNLDVASTVVLVGLPWDHATLVQFEGRVWRLTSKRPVNVFVVMTRGSLDERKWELLLNKGAAADVALDGQLIDKPEPPTDWSKVIAEMIESGAEITGEEVPEAAVKTLWDRIVPLTSLIDPTQIVREGPAPLPPAFKSIKPLKGSEQLALFDGERPPVEPAKRRSRARSTAGR